MKIFDGHMAVGWSANAKPKTGKDSVWIAVQRPGLAKIETCNPSTRHKAMDQVQKLLKQATRDGHRFLCGFDFPFGYPAGTASRLTGRADADWRDVWSRIAAEIEDCSDNSNNRFDVAAKMNESFEGEGPFWGRHKSHEAPGVPTDKPAGWGANLPPELRCTETVNSGAQPVWKLFYPGSVGSQALTGIAALEALRHEVQASVWPFEQIDHARNHVFAEIYPSQIKRSQIEASEVRVKDEKQVRAVVQRLCELGKNGELGKLLDPPTDEAVRREEGRILDLGEKPAIPGG